MNVTVVKEMFKAQPRMIILIAVLVLLNICLYIFAAAYQKPRLESLQNQWFDKRKLTTGGHALDTATVYQQGMKDLMTWRARIIPKKEFARFVGSLYETAANNTLVFNGMSYKILQIKEHNLVTYSLDINVAGKYAGIKSFISDVEHMPEIVTIENIALNNKNSTADAVDLKVQLTVYLRMEEQ